MAGKLRINQDRMKENFLALVEIYSPSRNEADVAGWIREKMAISLGAEVIEDNAAVSVGGNCNNMVLRLSGDRDARPLFLNAHMDTVEPASGVRPLVQDGVIRSDGATVLGADDKAAIAIIFEAIEAARECNISLPPLDLVFTVCEEIGLLGAKALDTGLIRATQGYCLDSTGTFNLINQAPEAVRFTIDIHGRSAHAGIEPEKGINAILLAARAMAEIPCGRIDAETTSNIGMIKGGTATNIVPDLVTVQGEVRSHNHEMLKHVQDEMMGAFYRIAMEMQAGPMQDSDVVIPRIESTVDQEYPAMKIDKKHPLVLRATEAAAELGKELQVMSTGGGSDANVFNGKGLDAVILGIGMRDVHTCQEHIHLKDMADTAAFLSEIIGRWS